MVNKHYKLRIYPTATQVLLILRTVGCARFIYNQLLIDSNQHYNETKQYHINTPAQYKKEFEWLKEVDSMALCNAQMNLKNAYSNFFRNVKKTPKKKWDNPYGFPKLKSKKNSRQSYTTNSINNSIRIEDGKLRLPKLGFVDVVFHRKVEGKIKSVTVSKSPSGKYFVSILTEINAELPKQLSIIGTGKEKVTGLDWSMPGLYVTNLDERPNPPKWFYEAEKKIARLSRLMSRKVLGSKNRDKARIRMNIAYEKMTNQKADYLHKLSYHLINDNDVIVVEDIDLSVLKQLSTWGKTISSQSFGMLRTFIKYKAERAGKLLYKVDKWFPSTQICSVCGYKNTALKNLSIREWDCPCCSAHHGRDRNSAQNLVNEYFRQNTAASAGINDCGETTTTSKHLLKASSLSEAIKVGVETPSLCL